MGCCRLDVNLNALVNLQGFAEIVPFSTEKFLEQLEIDDAAFLAPPAAFPP